MNKMGLILVLTSAFVIVASSLLLNHRCSMSQDGGHVVDHVFVNQTRLILVFNISI